VLLLIVGLILFIGLVVVHEFGHFIMARRNGVDIEEFGIGFPPRIWKKRIKSPKGDYDFTINLLPLGGFVRMKGEHDSDTTHGTFGAASLAAKSKIMVAGVVMNLITAFLLLTFLALIGIPKIVENQFTVASDTKIARSEIIIGGVEKGSPAAKGGIQQADHIVSLGQSGREQKITSSKELTAATSKNAGQKVSITYTRKGEVRQGTTTIRSTSEVEASKKTDNPKGYLGVYPTDYVIQRSTWSAPIVGAGLIKQFTVLTFQGLGNALKGLGGLIAGAATGNSEARSNGQKNASEQVSGPVGIFVILRDGSSLGFQFVLMIIAIISLTLAIMNILPIPALDGGRLWLTLATRGLGRPISQEKEELINASGFLLLMLLIVLITIVDVKRFF
jgi:regulator of sigma E protease